MASPKENPLTPIGSRPNSRLVYSKMDLLLNTTANGGDMGMAKQSLFSAMAKDAARKKREREKAEQLRLKKQEQARKEAERQARLAGSEARQKSQLAQKEAKQKYLEERIAEVDDNNSGLNTMIEELEKVLEHTLSIDKTITFDELRIKDEFEPFQPLRELAQPAAKYPKDSFFSNIKQPGGFGKLLPGTEAKYQQAVQEAEANYQKYLADYDYYEKQRVESLEKAQAEYERNRQAFKLKVQQRDQEVDEFQTSYRNAEPDAIVTYNSMVLESSEYPEGFPQEFRVAFVPESKQLVVEYELPSPEIVPSVLEYTYMKTKDLIQEKPRKATELKERYQDIVASTALRTIHEVYKADQGSNIEVVVFNGFVQTIDPATGKDIRPHLISVRATKESFYEIDLARVEKRACLRNLGAQVSPRPAEMQAVKPIIEFDMVDKRFVEESDVLADLESRPNLMELNPFEFENLVTNLFEQMGFESKLTRSSKDGGVDCIAFDTRPIIGGKVVIQAKRWKNTVGVSAVRDLYGTMINEGANKGILVSTSGYGPDAFNFANDKPIELVDGGGLLYLLEQIGVRARIIFPTEG